MKNTPTKVKLGYYAGVSSLLLSIFLMLWAARLLNRGFNALPKTGIPDTGLPEGWAEPFAKVTLLSVPGSITLVIGIVFIAYYRKPFLDLRSQSRQSKKTEKPQTPAPYSQ